MIQLVILNWTPSRVVSRRATPYRRRANCCCDCLVIEVNDAARRCRRHHCRQPNWLDGILGWLTNCLFDSDGLLVPRSLETIKSNH